MDISALYDLKHEAAKKASWNGGCGVVGAAKAGNFKVECTYTSPHITSFQWYYRGEKVTFGRAVSYAAKESLA